MQVVTKPENRNSLRSLKCRNRKLVLSYMRNANTVSVNEISRTTGLSKMTVHKIIDYYLDNGMIMLAGKGESTDEGGKKPNLFAFNPNCRYLYAVKLGDGFISLAVANLKGELIVPRHITRVGDISFDEVMATIRRQFDAMLAEYRLPAENCLAVVVGCNGVVDVENGVCLAHYQHPSWGTNLPIRASLANHFPSNVPIYVDSWWRHLANGEIVFSGAANRHRFFLMGNSGDYISGGMVADGHVLTGATGFAGEIGHMVIRPDSTEQCICGGTGCFQSLVLPAKVAEKALERRTEYPDSLIFRDWDSPEPLFHSIVRASNRDDALACLLMDETASHYAVAINNIVQTCDPGLVLLYGDLAHPEPGEYFLTRLRRKVNGLTMRGIDKRTQIEYTAVNDDWAIVGAATQIADALFAATT